VRAEHAEFGLRNHEDEAIKETLSREDSSFEPRQAAAEETIVPHCRHGGSAGSFEAFSRILTALPAKTGVAFVILQHLDPTSISSLPGMLASSSKLPVSEATDGMQVRPDHVYVLPADSAGKHEARKALPKQNSLAHENARLAQEVAQLREQLQLLIGAQDDGRAT
jgi:chemotaxis response regulator CheB